MVILGDSQQRELAISLAKSLSSSGWYSTQETSYALLALAKMANKNGGKRIVIFRLKTDICCRSNLLCYTFFTY